MEMQQSQNGDQYNFRNIMIGLVFLFISTFVFISQFRIYDPHSTIKQSIGIFFCVGFFTVGAMLVFSSITFKNRMIYLIAPFVVILGTFFVMNFVHLTGIAKIVNDYPQLQMNKSKLQTKVMHLDEKIKVLAKKNSELEARYYIQKAKSDFFTGKKLDAVISELKAAADSMKGTESTVMLGKLQTLIGHLEKMPANVTEEFVELEGML